MALPPPNQTAQQGQQYSNFSTKEAIGTAIRAGFLQFQANQIAKSSFLKMIPGASIVRERAELKKRELYEKTGRDEQGRKLTKQELEERARARADKGKLAEIHDIIQSWNDKWGSNDEGVAVYFKKDSDILFLFESMEAHIKLIHGFLTGAGTMGTSTYGSNQGLSLDDVPDRNTSGDELAAEERAQEQEREDDQDQLESEGRQQGFFTKLFGDLGRGRDRSEEGIFSFFKNLLTNLLSPITSLFGKGLDLFMKSLVGPIGKALLGSLTGVTGVLGTILKAMVSFIGTAFIPLLLAGAAGLAIRKFINDKTQDVMDAGERRGKQSIKKKYEVSDGRGGTTLKTAEELGTTDFALSKTIDEAGMATLPSGEKVQARGVDFMVDEAGNITETLSTTNTREMLETYRKINKPYESQQAKDTAAKGAGALTKHPWILKGLQDLNADMAQYQSMYDMNLKNIDDPTTGQMLASGWNKIKEKSMEFVDALDELKNKGPLEKTAAEYGKKLLDIYSNQYGIFADSLFDGENFIGGYTNAEYLSGGVLMSGRLKLPSEKAGFFGGYSKTQTAQDTELMGKRVLDYDIDKAANEGMQPLQPMSLPTPSGAAIPSTSNENAALQSAPSNAVSVNSNTNNVNQSNSAVIANGVSARVERTGIDNPIWNGYLAMG